MEEAMDVEMVLVAEDEKIGDPGQASTRLSNLNPSPLPEIQVPESRYGNRAGTFLTGIDIFSKEEKLKMEERAVRFGLTDKLKSNPLDQEQNLYASMGIVEDNDSAKNIRFNVIHMRGTEEMSTKDVFKYFEDYAPASIEWINDISCNVVWLDNISAARAMIGLSKKIIGLGVKPVQTDKTESINCNAENDINNEDCTIESDANTEINEGLDKNQEDYIDIKDIKCPLPPGIWRKGIDYPKSKGILLRFATRADKKQPNAEKMSEYYKKYGNPNFGGIKGILTETRKRMYKQTKQRKRKLTEESENENQDRKRVKNPWGALSENWGLQDVMEDNFMKYDHREQGRSVKERLGVKLPEKVVKEEKTEVPDIAQTDGSSSSSDNEVQWCKRSKALRMRMHADDEEEKIHKRRAKVQLEKLLSNVDKGRDLRSRLGKPRGNMQLHDPIRVVITNTKVTRPDSSSSEASEGEDGEIIENGEIRVKEEVHSEEEGELDDEIEEEETEDESDEPAKEVQGPKGSVIKVVQHKPRVASTVWARLNNVQSDVIDSTVNDRQSKSRDLRRTLMSGDLRTRIGKHTSINKAPLRIEVINNRYKKEGSETK